MCCDICAKKGVEERENVDTGKNDAKNTKAQPEKERQQRQ